MAKRVPFKFAPALGNIFKKSELVPVRATADEKRRWYLDSHMSPDPLYVANANATHRLIFLCGVRETPHGWDKICQHWQKGLPHFDFVLPAPPIREITHYDYKAPAWFDLPAELPESRLDMPATELSEVGAYVKQHVKDPSKTVLMGFSQGAAAALAIGLQMNDVGAMVSIAGYLPAASEVLRQRSIAKMKPVEANILLMHGRDDKVVDPIHSEMTKKIIVEEQVLKQQDQLHLEIFKKATHEITREEIDFAEHWLKTRFPVN